MKVIRPTVISPSQLISSSLAENDYAAYAAGTSYALADRVIYAHKIWESRVTGNLANTPNLYPLKWLDLGPTNRWAMLDEQTSTLSTSNTGSLSLTIATGLIDSVVLIGVVAYQSEVVLRDGLNGPIVYSEILPFSGDAAVDWYQYFFFDPDASRSLGVVLNLPPYQSSHLTVTLTSADNVAIGNLVCGLTSDLGGTDYGATVSITDYSRKDTDEFGYTTFVKRAFSKRMNASLQFKNTQLNRIQRLLYSLRATPCVWIGSDYAEFEEALVVYGFYRDFTTTIAYYQDSLCSIEIEGLI